MTAAIRLFDVLLQKHNRQQKILFMRNPYCKLWFLLMLLLPVVAMATPDHGIDHFAQSSNFDAYSMGNGKIHFKILIYGKGNELDGYAGNAQIDTTDLLAAFAGSECIGVTKPVDNLFYLYITSPSQDNEDISLRYYSVRLRNVFQADTRFSFVNGARLGSVSEPLKPLFESME